MQSKSIDQIYDFKEINVHFRQITSEVIGIAMGYRLLLLPVFFANAFVSIFQQYNTIFALLLRRTFY